ncbi:MAG: hypothetical protein DRN09_02470, partial [Thermoplasmata archaeon]
KYIVTKWHILQFIYESGEFGVTIPDIAKFFNTTTSQVRNSLYSLHRDRLIKIVGILSKGGTRIVRYHIYITDRGKRLIEEKHNGNICGFCGYHTKRWLSKYNKCVVPKTLDVNWAEKVEYPDDLLYKTYEELGID